MDLSTFLQPNFFKSLKSFFEQLNIPVNYISEEPSSPKDILTNTFREKNMAFALMDKVYFLGMVDDAAFDENDSLDPAKIKSDYDGILIFGVTLRKRADGLLPTRTYIADITRAFNREFHYTPVVVIFKYKDSNEKEYITFANAERLPYKQEWREGEKAGKVSMLKDIHIVQPHRGHIDILGELQIKRSGKNAVNSFDELYQYWQSVFNVSVLNKQFYKELSHWYFWALREVKFPNEPQRAYYKSDNEHQEAIKEHNGKNVIRLLTRILFVWFIKEKKLIPEELFDPDYLRDNLLKKLAPEHEVGLFKMEDLNSYYYKAILQNLFFATLNQEMGKRAFRRDAQNQGVTNLMRYRNYFKSPDRFIEMVEAVVPFMNGGLFECLDKDPVADNSHLIDGFSERKANDLQVPDFLFFDSHEVLDLSTDYGSKRKAYKNAETKGLIKILQSYKFTIAENTPIEQEIALDPELLGKVFENLLASYNPETKTTARKQTGSFYTPREIVNYMVDESLIEYLKTTIYNNEKSETELNIFDKQLHQLFSYDVINPFLENDSLTNKLIHALDNCKILDPACGSGAFPMGALQKMVHVLNKLDPNNEKWKERQIEKVNQLEDFSIKSNAIEDIEEAFNNNELDYGRKLYLIENCIYGVDIQPVATQISKLRFFISLIVDQKVDKNKENFGIRPLPNLETKFVSANTLIGIEKETNLFDTDDIRQLENQLKDNRQKIFSAKTPKTKRKYREIDKRLREAIAQKLEGYGMSTNTAKQLANWNPFDQNASADFFDMEWMFGEKNGFDVVIGNPPYGVSIKGNYRKDVLKYLDKVPDYEIYYFFIEASKKIISEKGKLSYIIPNTYLFNVFAEKYRLNLLSQWNVIEILDLTNYIVFEGVTVRNSIILFEPGETIETISFINTNSENIELNEFLNYEKNKLEIKLLKDFSQNWALAFKLPLKTIKVLSLIKERSNNLKTYFPAISQGLIAYDKYRGQDNKIIESRAYHSLELIEGWKKWLWGEDVTKYQVKWNEKEYIDYGEGIANPRNPKYFVGKRLLIREITNPTIFSGITDEELYNDPAIIIVKNAPYSLEIVSIILNSIIGTFFHFNSSPKATKGDFPKILVKDIKEFPISKSIETCDSDFFINLYFLFKEASIIKQDYLPLFESIEDGIAMELYFSNHMQEKEINIIEYVKKDIKKVMGDRDFESLEESEKEQIVKELHQIWTHPDNEVRNRIKLFAVRSPDILKPILESK